MLTRFAFQLDASSISSSTFKGMSRYLKQMSISAALFSMCMNKNAYISKKMQYAGTLYQLSQMVCTFVILE